MNTVSENGIFWRNILLALAGVCLTIAFLTDFRPWVPATLPPFFLSLLAIIVGGLFAALGIREFAGLLFRLDDRPWYSQPGGIVFLGAMLAAITLLALWVLAFFRARHLLPGSLSLSGMAFACLSAELFWVVMLDWPRATATTGRQASLDNWAPTRYGGSRWSTPGPTRTSETTMPSQSNGILRKDNETRVKRPPNHKE